MEWQVAAAAIGGLVGQFFKAQPHVPTWIPQVIMLVAGTAVFVIFNPPTVSGWELAQYVVQAILAGSSVNGAASLIGLHPALKTSETP